MKYLGKRFSVSYGSREYRDNWSKIFQAFDPLTDCPHVEKCLEVGKNRCNADCEMISWTEKEWQTRGRKGDEGVEN